MSRIAIALAVAAPVALAFLCDAASAQALPGTGFYGVARGGVSVKPDQKFGTLPSGSAFDDKFKYKTGFQGEIGGGYDFGLFRLEQTVGYSQVKPKASDADGRTRSFNLLVSGFVDIPTGTVVTPYVGAGAGIARVDSRIARGTGPIASAYDDKDYGLLWHASAGIGIDVAPKVTVELGGRYSQTSMLKFEGSAAGQPATFKPKLRAVSGTAGVRFVF